MRLDEVTAEIRPRSDWEAVDLGFAMVRRDFWRCWCVWWLAVLVPLLVAGWFLWDRPLLLLALFWWGKPAASRMVLFEISRRLFGERPGWRAVWREIPRAWGRRFFHRFVLARLSPWLPVTLAVEDLEGLRGKAYRQRCAQVVRRGEGAVMWLYFAADAAAMWLGMGLLAVVQMFVPEGQDESWRLALEMWDSSAPFDIPLIILRVAAVCLMVSMSLTDVFVTGAGFGIYLNNRTWVEGWDVELGLRRLAQRLGKVAVVVLLGLICLQPGLCAREPAEVIAEVKADEAFKVHTRTYRDYGSESGSGWEWLDKLAGLGEVLGSVFLIAAAATLLGFVGWMIWRFRHVFLFLRAGGPAVAGAAPRARVVMGLEVTAESLPPDVPGAAWRLWSEGRWLEAMALLYRGAIAGAIEVGRVAIGEADTEGDCLRRVAEAGGAVDAGYFGRLTGVWIRAAYAGERPAEDEVRALCEAWPFSGRRVG
jgi:hypothetical protein